jgi:hypothetical protein
MSKGMMKLFHNGNEKPRIVSMAAWSPSFDPGNNVIIAGVSGKIIVPVWMLFTGTHTVSAIPTVNVRSDGGAGDNREKMLLDTYTPQLQYGQSLFIDYGMSLFRVMGAGEGIKVYTSGTANGTYTITLGYYLVDP